MDISVAWNTWISLHWPGHLATWSSNSGNVGKIDFRFFFPFSSILFCFFFHFLFTTERVLLGTFSDSEMATCGYQLVAILAILVLLSLVPTKQSLCSFHCLSIDGMSGLVAFLPDLGHRAQLCNSFVARCRCLVILVETKGMSHRFCPTDYFELIIDTKIG